MNKATEVMMQYVENLKRTYEKDHAELMEFKKLANQNSNRCYGGSVDTGGTTLVLHKASMLVNGIYFELIKKALLLLFTHIFTWNVLTCH